MIDLDLVLFALYNPFLMWAGYIILSKQKQNWYLFLLLFVSTLVANYYLHLFIGSLTAPLNFGLMMVLTTFLDRNWKRNFYLLTVSVITIIFIFSWTSFIFASSMATSPLFMGILKQTFFTLLAFALLFKFFGRIQSLDFVTNSQHEYSDVFTSIVAIILGAYYWAHLYPYLLDLRCSNYAQLQLFHITMLTFSINAIFMVISGTINKSIKLNFSSQHLKEARSKLEHAERERLEKETYIKQLDGQLATFDATSHQIGKFQHDMRFILRTLNEARQAEKWDAFEQILEDFKVETIGVIDSLPNLPAVNHLGSKLFTLRTMLLNAVNKAEALAVDLSIDIPEVIEEIGMPIYYFCRILENWLNNAFEETIHVEDKSIHISFVVITEADGTRVLFLKVVNNCRPKLPLCISELKLEGVSSKGNSRGYGLAIVASIVNKFENVFISTSTERVEHQNKFIQTLEVVLNEIPNSNEKDEA